MIQGLDIPEAPRGRFGSMASASSNGTSLSKAREDPASEVEDKKKIRSRWRSATRTFLFGKNKSISELSGDEASSSPEDNNRGPVKESNGRQQQQQHLPQEKQQQEGEKKVLGDVGRKSTWSEHVWSTFILRGHIEDDPESCVKGSELITEFQRAKFCHFFYHVLDLNSDHVISQEDFDRLNERVRHYMDWSVNSFHYLSLREVHSLFLQHFLSTSTKISKEGFDFCDPFKSINTEEEEKEKDHVSIDEWIDVWGQTVGKAKKLDDLPMWLQYYPKTLFNTINRSGSGVISKQELRLFYTAFMDVGKLGERKLSELTEKAYYALTSAGGCRLTYHVYKLSFLNFLLGKQPNGPGQYIFGSVESKGLSSVFRIDYSALNSTQEEREKYSPKKLEEKGNRSSVIV